VGDEFTGRKMKCPKCKTRIRHHKDGTIELLTVGNPPPVPAAPAAAPAPAVEEKHETTVAVSLMPEAESKLVAASESKQNQIVGWGVGGLFVLFMVVMGIALNLYVLAIFALAAGLVAAFVGLSMRYKRKSAELQSLEQKAAIREKEEKTEPIPKV
jgi:hypothetical protein